jgi:bacterioferritin
MKGNPEIIALLNKGLTYELSAVNQYLAQSKMCKRWGYHKLADELYADYQDERIHAELLIERILFLEGCPEIKVGERIRLGSNVQEQLENDLSLELGTVNFYNETISSCIQAKDTGSRETAEFLLKSSEDDVQELEAHLNLIKQIGLQNYLIEQIGEKKVTK